MSEFTPRRPYNSPLRAAQAEDTRERILQALERLLSQLPESDVPFDAIAVEAGVERRTIFRHFETREALFDAFWLWFNARQGFVITPADPAELIDAPKAAFARFDLTEGVVRSSLHSASGRAMRRRATPARRAAISAALAPVTKDLSHDDAALVTALAHLLYSAPAWEVMKDFGGLTGTQAGQAASWALRLILSAASRGDVTADPASPMERKPR
jgi:AcrR family transcriptional regulator